MTARLHGPARDQTAADLRTRYEAGDSIRGLAASTGRSYSYIRDLLVQAGTTMRPRGYNPTHHRH